MIKNTLVTVYHLKGYTVTKYMHTEVCKVNDDSIILNADRYLTRSTKRLMNEVLQQYTKRYTVVQRKRIWYVINNDDKSIILFKNSMKLKLN